MEKCSLLITVISLVCLIAQSKEIEKPLYEVVHVESDFEIRLYSESTWVAALVTEISFEKATLKGFHRLFQYVQGANQNWTRIPLTVPIVTSIVPGAGPFRSSAYAVLLYLPAGLQDDPPVSLPQLHLKPFLWSSHCVAVRTFLGFPKDDNIIDEAEKLAASLRASPFTNVTYAKSKFAYSIAQYDSPLQFLGRVNEVWADVNASGVNGCGYGNITSY